MIIEKKRQMVCEKKNKKAQVSVFVIVAILILSVMGVYFLVKENVLDLGTLSVSSEVKPIYSFVEDCVEKTAKGAVYQISDTGGYFVLPDLSTENNIAYYMYEGGNYMPSKERVEEELSTYMNEMLFFCTKNFVYFSDFEVEQSAVESVVKIEEDSVVFDVEYDLDISKGGKTYSFKDFDVEVPVRLGVVYDVIDEIMVEQMTTPKDICVTCLEESAIENNLQIAMWDYDDAVIFSVVDLESELNGEVFEFYFANKYEV